MNYRLSKKQLEKSAYYCGAGIDLQPLLRFSQSVDDYIYVSVGVSKETIIEGVEHCLESLAQDMSRSTLILQSHSEIKLSDIEHDVQNKLIASRPKYFSEREYFNYIENFKQFYSGTDDFLLEFSFLLKAPGVNKTLRIFYIHGEALATYDVFFRQQKIAPKIFISIQTGCIEVPSLFCNEMFRQDKIRPKVWVRGVWGKDEMSEYESPNVFKPIGIYDTEIGEYPAWNSNFGYEIEGTTDKSKPNRLVKAYGESSLWTFSPDYIESIENREIIINKLNKRYYPKYRSDYNEAILGLSLTRLDKVNEAYLEFCARKPTVREFKVAIYPIGYEFFEACIRPFTATFQSVNNVKLVIDIYYGNIIDLKGVL